MKCQYLKYRSKNYLKYTYCSLLKRTITVEDCDFCKNKEYKQYKYIKPRTNKQSRREKERFSIIYPNLDKCCVCGSKIGVQKNEIFEGAYRSLSIKYGMIAPMCYKETCHKKFHNDSTFNLYYKTVFQNKFMETHSLDEFIKIFGQNYIFKLEQKKRTQSFN